MTVLWSNHVQYVFSFETNFFIVLVYYKSFFYLLCNILDIYIADFPQTKVQQVKSNILCQNLELADYSIIKSYEWKIARSSISYIVHILL